MTEVSKGENDDHGEDTKCLLGSPITLVELTPSAPKSVYPTVL
jgi:hypothetical protein